MTISRKFYNFLKWLLLVVAIFFGVLIIVIIFYIGFEKKYANQYFPGIKVADTDVGGLTRMEAEKKINQKIDKINKEGVEFAYHNERATFDILLTSAEADIAWPIVMFDVDDAFSRASDWARSDSWFDNIKKRISLFRAGKEFDISVTISQDELDNFLKEKFSHFSTPAKDAQLIIASSTDYEKTDFSVKEEVYGQVLDFAKASQSLRDELSHLNNNEIILEANIEYPSIYKKDCFNINAKAQNIIRLAPFELRYKEKTWVVKYDDLLKLMELKNKDKDKTQVYVSLDQARTEEFLNNKVAVDINKEAVESKFEIVNGKVEQFQMNQDGLKLDEEKSFEIIEQAISNKKVDNIILASKIVNSKNNNEKMADFGIREIIGTGHSNFRGSPSNRRHNIRIGANSVNGTLIAPGEEFSLLKTLGKIDGSTGYLQELVIKEGKTIPEYGGGLCQIGTTVFRATVQSGLPVTMRRNHSYRVSYYEPAGTDATIYDPWPDYKFKNDTAHHILIQSRIDGNNLYFDFWGTKDGRVATSTYPVIYNFKKPGPTKIIETLDLKPGQKHCTEHAHNGADAYFDYKVTYPDGKEASKRFKSHYVPWQAVCLVGVEKLSTSTEMMQE